MIEALAGYAIGTFQILALAWFQNRAAHRTHLRLLRAELRRLASINGRFGWSAEGPNTDTVPLVPELTPTFLQTVVSTDFHLTDEHEDDNTQQALLELQDLTNSLRHYQEQCLGALDTAKDELGDRRRELLDRATELAAAYDETAARLATQLASALADTERRLRDIAVWRQLTRPLGRLPRGANPPSLPAPSWAKPPNDAA
jgi:hypothetical protein